jgi:hypothetical protein
MRRIKVRFNLGKGKNYLKWKIQSTTGVEYHYPDDVQLIMHNCILKNNRKVADKIHSGENKDVCAWILCESISILSKDIKWQPYLEIDKTTSLKLRYNPRVAPYWTTKSHIFSSPVFDNTHSESNADNTTFNKIASLSKELFIIPN